MKNSIPFPAYAGQAPLDISFLFDAEKPAGKHGFLKVQGDHFAFEDGTVARFWGTNLNSGACFPEKPYAEKLAKRIAAYGCNIVRLHQMDAEWANPNIFQFRKGKRLDNTRSFDAESLDRMDYMISCMEKEGIYIFLDMMTYRKFKEGDGVVNANLLIDRAAPYSIFDRKLIELQKEYMSMLWNHVNHYTGKAYKDDPAVALSDIVNEVDLFGAFGHKIVVEPYASNFRKAFAAWCTEKGYKLDTDAVDLNDQTVDELVEYKGDVVKAYYDEMIAYVHSLGVKIPVTGPNFSWKWAQCKYAQRVGEFGDSHLNVRFMKWNPGEKISRDISLHDKAEWGAMRNARMRSFGRPFFTSEWDVTYPNKYRAESPILFAAVGRLQDWSGYCLHTYAYTSMLEYMDILGKEVHSETIGNVGYREGIFSCWNDPAKFGLFYHAAIITRRGDVRPAEKKITIRVGALNADNKNAPGTTTTTSKAAFEASTELSQIGVDYEGTCAEAVDEMTKLVDPAAGFVRSDTGELFRSWEKGYGTIDTPMTKCVYGELAKNGAIELDGLTVTSQTGFSVIALSSLNNDLPLDKTDAILLSAVGVVENTDQKMSLAAKEIQPKDGLMPYMQMDDFGKAPILCEATQAEIRLRTNRTNLAIWSVNAEGLYAGKVPVTYEDGCAVFTIGTKYPSIYYLIYAE